MHKHKVRETKLRSLLKTLTGRLLEITLATFLFGPFIGYPTSLTIAIISEGICAIVSYINDRGWNLIQFGRQVEDIEDDS